MQQIHFLNTEFLFQKAYELIAGQDYFGLIYLLLGYVIAIVEFFRHFYIIISILLIAGIIYSNVRIKQIREEEKVIYGLVPPAEVVGEEVSNLKWKRIVDHFNSDNENDWKIAILEADIILDEMLTAMSYHGDTMSDKLKSVERSDFNSIDDAWEAHKIRNQVAHEGPNFRINQREARRVMGLYERVFKEFRYI